MDSLFKELVMFGFLKKSETVALKDYIGETPPRPLLPGWERPKAPRHSLTGGRLAPSEVNLLLLARSSLLALPTREPLTRWPPVPQVTASILDLP